MRINREQYTFLTTLLEELAILRQYTQQQEHGLADNHADYLHVTDLKHLFLAPHGRFFKQSLLARQLQVMVFEGA